MQIEIMIDEKCKEPKIILITNKMTEELNSMPHSIVGVLIYVSIFIAIFAFTWIIQYMVWKRKIHKMNERVKYGNK